MANQYKMCEHCKHRRLGGDYVSCDGREEFWCPMCIETHDTIEYTTPKRLDSGIWVGSMDERRINRLVRIA